MDDLVGLPRILSLNVHISTCIKGIQRLLTFKQKTWLSYHALARAKCNSYVAYHWSEMAG